MVETPTAVGHVHLKVRSVEPAVAFYTDVLGLEETERHGRFAFLSWGARHHDIALQAVGTDAAGPGPGVGLYHAAFEVPSAAGLRAVDAALEDRGVQRTPVDHGISKALYFEDPDGNGLEVYLDTRAERDRYRWDGRNAPFDPADL